MEIIRKIRIYNSVSCGISLRISYGISHGYLTEYLTDISWNILQISHGISYGYLTEYLTEYLPSGCGLFSLRNLYVYTCVTGFLYDREFVVPPIFNYLIGAKNVEIRLVCTLDMLA